MADARRQRLVTSEDEATKSVGEIIEPTRSRMATVQTKGPVLVEEIVREVFPRKMTRPNPILKPPTVMRKKRSARSSSASAKKVSGGSGSDEPGLEGKVVGLATNNTGKTDKDKGHPGLAVQLMNEHDGPTALLQLGACWFHHGFECLLTQIAVALSVSWYHRKDAAKNANSVPESHGGQ